jgi:hypothetical protein
MFFCPCSYCIGGCSSSRKLISLTVGGCWPSKKLIIFLMVTIFSWRLMAFKKLIYLVVKIFSYHFGKLGVVLVSLAANLQRNHPCSNYSSPSQPDWNCFFFLARIFFTLLPPSSRCYDIPCFHWITRRKSERTSENHPTGYLDFGHWKGKPTTGEYQCFLWVH